jgi:hypothetical protein
LLLLQWASRSRGAVMIRRAAACLTAPCHIQLFAFSVAIPSTVPRARAAATAAAPDAAGLAPLLPLERAHKFAPFGRPIDVLNFSQRLTAREPLAATATFKFPSVYVNVPAALVSCSAASASPAVEFDVFVADRRCWLRCPPSRLLTTSGAGAGNRRAVQKQDGASSSGRR